LCNWAEYTRRQRCIDNEKGSEKTIKASRKKRAPGLKGVAHEALQQGALANSTVADHDDLKYLRIGSGAS
jgi:hypothetical protein